MRIEFLVRICMNILGDEDQIGRGACFVVVCVCRVGRENLFKSYFVNY